MDDDKTLTRSSYVFCSGTTISKDGYTNHLRQINNQSENWSIEIMGLGLFRKQAIESQRNRLHGNVMLLPHLSHAALTLFIFIWICAFFIWLFNGQYARKESVEGWLEPKEGEIRVYPNSSNGMVSKVLVSEGQRVSQGQALMIINGDRIMQDGTSLESQLYEKLEQQSFNLAEQHKRLVVIQQQAVVDARFQLASTEQDLARLKKQIEVLNTLQQMKLTRLERIERMANSGHIAKHDLDNAIEQKLTLESELQRLLREEISLRDNAKLIESSLQMMPQRHLNELADLAQKRSVIARQMLELDGRRARIIRAPKKGIIANLKVLTGKKVSASIPLLTLLPEGSVIEANLLIPVRAIGFLKPGQKIEIRYDAYPYQKFGLYSGEVSLVAGSVSLPEELGPVPVQPQEPVYIVKAKLNSDSVTAYGQHLKLKTGMTLNADIELGQRTLFEWLLEPIISLQGRV